MNIFYLAKCPYKAAELQYNKHVVKMILESAQMLCTAHHHYAEKHEINADYIPYKKAHYNHPSTIWCRQNKNHYRWLYNHMTRGVVELSERLQNQNYWDRGTRLGSRGKTICAQIGLWSDKGVSSSMTPPFVALAPVTTRYNM